MEYCQISFDCSDYLEISSVDKITLNIIVIICGNLFCDWCEIKKKIAKI